MTMAAVHMLGVQNVGTNLNFYQDVRGEVIVALSDFSIRVYFVNALLG